LECLRLDNKVGMPFVIFFWHGIPKKSRNKNLRAVIFNIKKETYLRGEADPPPRLIIWHQKVSMLPYGKIAYLLGMRKTHIKRSP
jgi:hypothetical protein